MVVHHQRQSTALVKMVKIGSKSLAGEKIVFRQRITHQIRRLGVNQRQRDQIITSVGALQIVATVAGMHVDTLQVVEMPIIITAFPDQIYNLRIDFHRLDIAPTCHQRIEHVGPAAGADDQRAFPLAKIIREKSRFATQEKQPSVVARKAKHIRTGPTVDIEVQPRFPATVHQIGAGKRTPTRIHHLTCIAAITPDTQRTEHRFIGGLRQRAQVNRPIPGNEQSDHQHNK